MSESEEWLEFLCEEEDARNASDEEAWAELHSEDPCSVPEDEQELPCVHVMDNQGRCHNCGILMDAYLWALYKGPSTP